jgi:CHAD domain-containing protein
MQCLEKYRSKQIREANRNLRVIFESPDESAVHEYRVCIKRLTALYGFLGQIDENLAAKKLLKPYRALFKKLGNIREAHIAIGLVEDLEVLSSARSRQLIGLLRSRIRRDYRIFRDFISNGRPLSVKLPTIRAAGIPPATISRQKPVYLDELLLQIRVPGQRMTVDGWHRKRILLKRFRHTLEAFDQCPGQTADQQLLKQISLLEQLLGDWHDRVVAAELLQSLPEEAGDCGPMVRRLRRQGATLLGSAKIYFEKFAQ